MPVTLRQAVENDLTAILSIAQDAALNENNKDDQVQTGFLVSAFTQAEYTAFLNRTRYFYAALADERVVGFLLAFEADAVGPDDVLNNLIRYNLVSPTVIVKQVCVHRDWMRQSVAASLYRHLDSQLTDTVQVAAAIVTEPLNVPSIAFHEKQGFVRAFDITPPADRDGRRHPRGVWVRPARADGGTPRTRLHYPDRQADAAQLDSNLQEVLQLYTHEDSLNWTKFGMLVTFMSALVTAFGYLLTTGPSAINRLLSILLIGLGFLILSIFQVMISSGVYYMSSHKERIKAIERKLQWCMPCRSGMIDIGDHKITKSSGTVKHLRRIPWICLAVWGACALILILVQFHLL